MLTAILYSLLGVGAIAIAGLIYCEEARKKERGSLPTPKGTYGIAFTWKILKFIRDGTIYDFVRECSKEYGWQPWVLQGVDGTDMTLHDPADVKHMMATNFNNYTLTGRKDVFEDLLGDGIFNSDGDTWRTHRRMSSYMFSTKHLGSMESVFQRNGETLRKLLSECANTNRTIDIQKMMFNYTFDSINEIAFGRSVNSLEGNEKDTQFCKAFDDSQATVFSRFINPLWKVMKFLNIGSERKLRGSLKTVNEYIKDVLTERASKCLEEAPNDVLRFFIEAAESEGKECSPEVLHDVVMNFLIAGRDTTAAAATWCFYELGRNPECLKKVEEEIKRVNTTADMHYSHAVFIETLRLHPSVPLDGKYAEEDDILPSGTKVVKGTNVNFHPLTFTMNPSLYPDPEKFDPTRWLDESGAFKGFDPYLFPQFNAGPRLCLGRHMAALEVKTILAEVLPEFDIVIDYDHKIFPRFSAVMQSANGVMARIQRKK
eukprot:TRINITY_DN865_c0_g1_i3.p1 TRINITY_DN865_c0_g1~~TRINITY_DN865_c0_g1_i3.p1  ORF type:complete len:486 (+),score=124.15 TRINITY_DN865_c0_g1_i3:55-1512(+)